MTPFGQRLRDLRQQHGRALKDMARALRVSSAYLAWEEVDELKALAELSDPKPSIDTRGLSPLATELANRLRKKIKGLDEAALKAILKQLGK
jgi:transcriptional regulator with XRE-family HTH domain